MSPAWRALSGVCCGSLYTVDEQLLVLHYQLCSKKEAAYVSHGNWLITTSSNMLHPKAEIKLLLAL